jgi:hypothetical protein
MRLECFSAKTWVAWFEVAWAALCADNNGRPETDPELKKLGLYRAEHSTERYSGTQLVATTKTRNANIRDGIKDKFRKAIQRLAEVPKKFSKK